MYQRTECGGCGNQELRTFLNLGESPLANDLPYTADQTEVFYPLQLGYCSRCWLVQMMHVVPHELVFGGDYTFFSSTSPALVELHRKYAQTLLDRYPEESKFTLEIACNDGSLLRHFARDGRKTVGIDPAAGPVMAAQDRELDVIHDSFGQAAAHRIRDEHGAPTLVLANHVTAHVTDLHDFLGGIKTVLNRDGVAILEVQYLPDLLLGNQIDHVYHEHRYFFSLTSLLAVARCNGLEVIDVERVDAQGGSIRVSMTHDHLLAHKIEEEVELRLIAESGIRTPFAYAGMQARADRIAERLHELLAGDTGVTAGYGMPAKATTLLNFANIGTSEIDFIVDTTPVKIGRFAPGVKIPIHSPNEPGIRGQVDTYVLFIWNYLRHIMRREQGFMENGGQFIIPIPAPVIV